MLGRNVTISSLCNNSLEKKSESSPMMDLIKDGIDVDAVVAHIKQRKGLCGGLYDETTVLSLPELPVKAKEALITKSNKQLINEMVALFKKLLIKPEPPRPRENSMQWAHDILDLINPKPSNDDPVTKPDWYLYITEEIPLFDENDDEEGMANNSRPEAEEKLAEETFFLLDALLAALSEITMLVQRNGQRLSEHFLTNEAVAIAASEVLVSAEDVDTLTLVHTLLAMALESSLDEIDFLRSTRVPLLEKVVIAVVSESIGARECIDNTKNILQGLDIQSNDESSDNILAFMVRAAMTPMSSSAVTVSGTRSSTTSFIGPVTHSAVASVIRRPAPSRIPILASRAALLRSKPNNVTRPSKSIIGTAFQLTQLVQTNPLPTQSTKANVLLTKPDKTIVRTNASTKTNVTTNQNNVSARGCGQRAPVRALTLTMSNIQQNQSTAHLIQHEE
ncbi:hypothetical protein HDU76_003624 [Blyttiomyces sp. JEL0837]|nr:hypothetical protein HDU76_003624 [Blyttiomyces sp. JEL0837]